MWSGDRAVAPSPWASRLGPHRDGCCRELDTIDILSQREVADVEFTALARECVSPCLCLTLPKVRVSGTKAP